MTSIEWTDQTWNPVSGCSKVSGGCKNCYAERLFPRPYPGRKFTDVRCHPERLDKPLHWRRSRRVFVNSMSDLFHDDVPDDFIKLVFAAMARAPQHVFQVLTKRPERMRTFCRDRLRAGDCFGDTWSRRVRKEYCGGSVLDHSVAPYSLPLPNVWLGVSVEDQATADERIPLLLDTPAALRFVSCEPLLSAVALPWLIYGLLDRNHYNVIDWVIVGGESGSKSRPCDLRWVRDIVAQCNEAVVPCFVKQLGRLVCETRGEIKDGNSGIKVPDRHRVHLQHPKGGDITEWPADLRVREFPE